MSKCLSDTSRSISRGSYVKWRSTSSNTKIIAVIKESVVIEKILTHVGLSAQPPLWAQARRVDTVEVDDLPCASGIFEHGPFN